MKKLLTILSAFVLTLTLFACGEVTTTSKTTGTGGQQQTTTGNKKPTKKTVVKYCGWDLGTEELNNVARRLIEKFNKESKDIRIDIVPTDPTVNQTEWLTQLIGAGNVPDVFLVLDVPHAIRNNWALDLSEFVNNDPEWQDVESALKQNVTYGDKVYALPAAQDYVGYKVNYDLLNNYATGLGGDAYDIFYAGSDLYTTDKFFEVVKSLRNVNPTTNGTGYIGLDQASNIIDWLPASLDETGTIKHSVWDGYSVQFKHEAVIDAIGKIQSISKRSEQYVLDTIPVTTGSEENNNLVEVRKDAFGGTNATEIFTLGRLGFMRDGSWTADTEYDFGYKFIGFPDNKVISAADYMCVSKTTKNKEAAYKVAKYLTFGLQGYLDRFSIIEANPDAGLTLDGLPVTTNTQVTEKWFDYVTLAGLEETFLAVAEGKVDVLVEPNKTVPGYVEARDKYNTGISIPGVRDGGILLIGDILWDACGGDITMDDYINNMSDTLLKELNNYIDAQYKALGITRTKPE